RPAGRADLGRVDDDLDDGARPAADRAATAADGTSTAAPTTDRARSVAPGRSAIVPQALAAPAPAQPRSRLIRLTERGRGSGPCNPSHLTIGALPVLLCWPEVAVGIPKTRGRGKWSPVRSGRPRRSRGGTSRIARTPISRICTGPRPPPHPDRRIIATA